MLCSIHLELIFVKKIFQKLIFIKKIKYYEEMNYLQSMSQSAMSRSETPVNNGSEHNGNGNGFHCRQESLDSASKRAYGGLLHQKRPSTVGGFHLFF